MSTQDTVAKTIRRFLYLTAVVGTAVNSISVAAAQSSYPVVSSVEKKLAPGNVAFVDTVGKRIVELDRAGKVVWHWAIPASVTGGGDIRSGGELEWIPADDSFLLAIPFHGIFRVNRAGNVIWQYRTSKVSHDADLLPNGNILYVFGWDARSDNQVSEIDPQGNLVWSWNVKGKVDEAWYNPAEKESRPSYTHTNAAVRLPDGDTIISLRNFNRVVRVGPSGEVKRVWGPIQRVHEPTLLPDGTLIASPHGPKPGGVIAIGSDGKRRTIFSNALGIHPIRTVEPLRNGNYLLTGGEEIVEIDAAGSVVWHVVIYPKAGGNRSEGAEQGSQGERRGGGRGQGGGGQSGGRTAGERGVYKAVWVGRGG